MNAIANTDVEFYREMREKSGQPIELCYHCQKCASGCIATEYADFYPNEILRLVQLGQKERALQCSSLWICSSCETCGARCPNGINMRAVIDALKEKSISENKVKEKEIHLFHTVFLNSVRANGRVHEPTMMAAYKLKTRNLFSDLGVGFDMFKKGKMSLLPSRVKDKKTLKNIFRSS